MPNLVKKSYLQDATFYLWNKIQEKLNSYVHKTKENTIVGKTILFDGYVAGAPLLSLDNPGAVHNMGNNTSYFVCTHLAVSANQKVGQITIGVNSNKQIGEVVTGVNIGAIKQSNKEVLDYIILNGAGIVHANTDNRLSCEKAITIDVDFAWTEDVYLIVGANGALWGPRNNIYGGNAMGGGSLPSVGSRLALNTGNYVGRVIVYGDVVSLRDLANSGTGGVSREEFTQHVTDNGQRISGLENNAAKLNEQNTFTSLNTFMERSPVVDKYTSIKDIYTADGIDVLFPGGQYCCTPKMGITSSEFIYAVLLPIKDSRPGDTVEASYFTVNADNLRLTSGILDSGTYTVKDVQYRGEYCIVFNVNKSFSYPVSFGFRVMDKVMPGRRIGMLKQDLPHQNNNNAWSSYNAPSNGQGLSYNSKFTIPYMIARRVRSEVATKYDVGLVNNYRLGELKTLIYDAGEQFESGGHTWLRCDGQVVSQSQLSEDSESLSVNTESITLPTSGNGEYKYICIV